MFFPVFGYVLGYEINLVWWKQNKKYNLKKKKITNNYKVPFPFTFTYYDMFQRWCSVNVDTDEIKV